MILFRKLRLKRLLKQKEQVEGNLRIDKALSDLFPQNESWIKAEEEYLKHLEDKLTKLRKK